MKALLKRTFPWLRKILVAAIVAIGVWTLILMIFENQFIFFPSKYPDGIYQNSHTIPNVRDCWIKTEDGITLHGWFAPADSPVATLVMSHGNAGNLSHRLYLIRALQRRDFNVLIYDYRGYGRSEGSPDEAGIYADGRAAFDYALTQPDIDPERIILWGTSLGGAVAVDVATQRPAAGLILEATFSSARDVARVAYPFLPVHFFLKTQLNSVEKIKGVRMPLLMLHGNRDSIIPLGLGRKLYDAADGPKEFYTIEGADHNDTWLVGGEAYFNAISRFSLALFPPAKNDR
ncbi:MAG: alpha/beta hydrolase [Bacteroidota bacterium]